MSNVHETKNINNGQADGYTEEAYIQDTLEHIQLVQQYIHQFILLLKIRAKNHDKSKLEEPEMTILRKHTPYLNSLEYGSEEYKAHLNKIRVALKHHYEHNSHHPEHYENGIRGMDLLDIVEMYFDWQASAIKYGNTIQDSIKVGQKRFNLSDDLVAIFENTARRL